MAAKASEATPPELDGANPPPEGDPEVVAPRGKRVVKLADWTVSGFNYTLGEGDDAKPITVTTAGVQVTQAQATEIREAAAKHGVAVTEEDA